MDVIPVVVAAAEFLEERLRSERIAHLPQLEHDQPSEQLAVERCGREAMEIVEVPDFDPLEGRPDLLGDHFDGLERPHVKELELDVSQVGLRIHRR